MEPAAPMDSDEFRPLVGRPVSNRGVWLFAGLLLLAALALFWVLESRRSAIVSPATSPSTEAAGMTISAPPPLALPGAGVQNSGYFGPDGLSPAVPLPQIFPQTLPGVPRSPRVVQQGFIPGPPVARAPRYFDPGSPDAPFVPGPPVANPATQPSPEAADNADRPIGERARATRFANPSYTIPQGAVIQAVLETALDSNRPGFVRAIVSRDVRSFDGSQVLIPRGSRLFGEYKADLAQGQNRATVQWQKLTRPDGVQIAIGSPAADPLGRAGVAGKVNSHFLKRFAGAFLQSTLDVGVGIATRSATGGAVILGLPGSTQNLTGGTPDSIKPTLRVRHGTSVSVFVARDLDFSSVESSASQ